MNRIPSPVRLLLAMLIALPACVPLKESQDERVEEFRAAVRARSLPFPVPRGSRLDSVIVDETGRTVTLRMSDEFSHAAYRPGNVDSIMSSLSAFFGEPFGGYTFRVFTLRQPLQELIPNYYRRDTSRYDRARMPAADLARPEPVVRNASRPFVPQRGLAGRSIGIWHSHGWYYNKVLDRWQWQRPRLFESVEDLGPMTVTLPYLVPMLENAGAGVFLPRERDVQRHEIVVDNDSSAPAYKERSTRPASAWSTGPFPGFAVGHPPYTENHNPFVAGTYRVAPSDFVASASCSWTPDIPEAGEYPVYVSYNASPDNVTDARYTVLHAGGRTDFVVNQQIGGSTWIYLGRFTFRRGVHPDSGGVLLTNESSQAGRFVSADAARFGAGMGLIARNGLTSGRPKYAEGARYYLQYAGMPDTLVYSLNRDTSDYKDDYQSRAEYLNYLQGAPRGPNRNREVSGLGIPVDLSLAFHTDAGITANDTVVGTLSIYTIESTDSVLAFPDSMSRMANRDLADLVQTQIVEDIRSLHDPAWNRRQLRNADYSESRRPNIPSVLLELLSHQNFLDMQFMLDPAFRFDVARAIYKAMLRFLATQHGSEAVVQPLPPTHFAATFSGETALRLRWRPAVDPLEPTAVADRYIVYTRVDDGGFDNGRLVEGTSLEIANILPDRIYSFRVSGVNEGGESFPSEILSVCRHPGSASVLIVNGFTRVAGPARVQTETFAGFVSDEDGGVPDRYALNYTGRQFDFSPASAWRTDDAPGHGASHADHEATVIAGNTFDFPEVHGRAILASGYSFCSASKAAVMEGDIRLGDYTAVDLILGEERRTHWLRPRIDSLRGLRAEAFPRKLQESLRTYCAGGGNLFVSGAYVGTDLFGGRDSADIKFATDVLKLTWVTGHASVTGEVVPTRAGFLPDSTLFSFNTTPSPVLYAVESPDAIAPTGGSTQILRYGENLFGAATRYEGTHRVVVFGFPLETVTDEGARGKIMRAILGFFRLP